MPSQFDACEAQNAPRAVPASMRAAVVYGKNQLRVARVPVPDLGPYQVLCQNLYGATCTATDSHIIDLSIAQRVDLPAVLGHESVGRVVSLGEKVRNLEIGQVVCRTLLPFAGEVQGLYAKWGGFAEYGIAFDWRAMKEDGLPKREYEGHMRNQVVPGDIDVRVAPLLITWRETHSYIRRMGLCAGQSVLVIGSGGNGLSFVNHASAAGARAACVGSPAREANAMQCGAQAYFSYRDEEYASKLREWVPGGFDIIIDAIGSGRECAAALPMIKRGGAFGIYGINDLSSLSLNPLSPGHSFCFYNDGYLEGETHQEIVEGVRRGIYRPQPYLDIQNPWPLSQIADAFAFLKQPGSPPKALIDLQDGDA